MNTYKQLFAGAISPSIMNEKMGPPGVTPINSRLKEAAAQFPIRGPKKGPRWGNVLNPQLYKRVYLKIIRTYIIKFNAFKNILKKVIISMTVLWWMKNVLIVPVTVLSWMIRRLISPHTVYTLLMQTTCTKRIIQHF